MPSWVDKLLNSQIVQLGLAALAFLIALWLVIVIARMLMGGRLRLPGGRTRQARLGIVDAFDLDRQRQLIIVRRDNTEHLIMIGGPNDLVIESEIVRVEARDFRDRRDKNFEAFGDVRNPSSLGGIEALNGGTQPRLDDPALPPAASPQPALADAPARAPTFPLPPRRPVERRSPPPLPERAARNDPPYSPSPEPVSAPAYAGTTPPFTPAPPPSFNPAPQPAPQIGLQASQQASQPSGAPTVGSSPSRVDDGRPVPPRASPFLKSLPPRPPARPLKRVTPVGDNGAGAPPLAQTNDVVPGSTLAARSAPAAVPPRQPEKDGLASLEEEMAKLLGR